MTFCHTILLIQNSTLNIMTLPTFANLLWTFCPATLYLHLDHTYDNVLASMLPSADTLYDFPISVYVINLDRTSSGRQHIYFRNFHNFLLLYNHSDFLKMHMHNAWLLGKTDLTIHLPSDYFVQPNYLLVVLRN